MAQPSEQNRHEVTSERSNANWSKAVARSGTSKTGLMNFTLRNLGVWTLRRGCCLSEASFSLFSSTLTDFSKIRAALIFCSFASRQKKICYL
jgi:hypothetical protein